MARKKQQGKTEKPYLYTCQFCREFEDHKRRAPYCLLNRCDIRNRNDRCSYFSESELFYKEKEKREAEAKANGNTAPNGGNEQ